MVRRDGRGSPLLSLLRGLALSLLLACSLSGAVHAGAGSRTEGNGGGQDGRGAVTGTATCNAGGAEASGHSLCAAGGEVEPGTCRGAGTEECQTRGQGQGMEDSTGSKTEAGEAVPGAGGNGMSRERVSKGEVMKERLTVRQLRDGTHALVSFQQRTSTRLPRGPAPPTSSALFPAFLLRLVSELRVERLSLTFTAGRWDYAAWGWASPGHAPQPKPAGVELWAALGVPEEQADELWEYLTRLLSGHFCAALASLASSGATAAPRWHLQPPDWPPARAAAAGGTGRAHRRCTQKDNNSNTNSNTNSSRVGGGGAECTCGIPSALRYAQLPQDLMCAENLEPWLRLLPCRGLAGPFAALNRTCLYAAPFQTLSLKMHAHRPKHPPAGTPQAGACASHTAAEAHAGAGSGAEVAEGRVHLLQEVAYIHRLARGVPDGSQESPGGGTTGGGPGGEGGGGGSAGPAWQAPPIWTLAGVLGSGVPPACPVASTSQLAVELDSGLFPEGPSTDRESGAPAPTPTTPEQEGSGKGGIGTGGGGDSRKVPSSSCCCCCCSWGSQGKRGNASATEPSTPPLPLPRPWAPHLPSILQVTPPAWTSATWTTPALTEDQAWEEEAESRGCQAGTCCQSGCGGSQAGCAGEEAGQQGRCSCLKGTLSLRFDLLPRAGEGGPSPAAGDSANRAHPPSDVSVSWGSDTDGDSPLSSKALGSTPAAGPEGVPPLTPLWAHQGLQRGTPSTGFSVEMYLLGGGNGGWQATLALELRRTVTQLPGYSDSAVPGDESLQEPVHPQDASRGTKLPAGAEEGEKGGNGCMDISVLQVLPWWVRPRYHTLALSLDGARYTGPDLGPPLARLGLQPGAEKRAPAVLELVVCAPRDTAHLLLTMQMDKVFLTVFDFPPDASRGLDMPPALVSISQCSSSRGITHCSPPEHAYASSVVLPMPEPDLSMPYNVITLTCTLLAMIIGSLLNVLRYRFEDRA